MHKLLERQLRKLYGTDRLPDSLRALLETVDETYRQADADRELLERSLDLTSRELLDANAELRREREDLERRVDARTSDLLRANSSLEREIGERREAENALRQSERRYQILAFYSPAGILHADGRGRCLYVNKKWCEMAGIGPREASGDGWLAGLHPQDRARVSHEWRRAVVRRLPLYSTEFRFRRDDKEQFWVFAQAVAIRGDDGGTSGYVLTATDITERRDAEEAILRSEERYRTLFEDSKDTVYMSSPEGRLLDINPAGIELLGYSSKEELLASDEASELPMRREARERLLQLIEEEGFVKDLELTATRRDGARLTLLATATPVRDAEGRIVTVRGILRDVTEQRMLERQLLQAQKMEAVGRLAGGVAHDFNNLLTAIIGYAELARTSLDDGAAEPHLKEILQASRRGAKLTQQLLAFSRRQVLEPQVLSLNRVIDDTESFLRRVIGEDVELVTDLDPELGAVRADRTQIEQVLLNLAVNARDAMPEGGQLTLETFNLDVAAGDRYSHLGLAPGRYVALAVSDTGIGIADDIRDQIFEPFFTTKESGRGTGLGLSTVYGIVRQSGGRIEVLSRDDQGSRFEIVLPLGPDQPEKLADEEALAEIPGGTETILLAEDEPAVRTFLSHFLRKQGYDVVVAEDGEEALRRAAATLEPIDLLVSDVVMPRLNGIELARRLRARQPGLRVILMSGHTDAPPGEVEDEATGFLQKPFSVRDLGRKIRELLADPRAGEAEAAGTRAG